MKPGEAASLLRRTIDRFIEDGAMRHGAALAFYATLSLAPLLLLLVSVVSLFPRDGLTDSTIIDQLGRLFGERATRIAEQILAGAPQADRNLFSLIGSIILLLIGGSVLFVNVKGTLNAMWNVKRLDQGILRGLVRARLVAFAMIFVTGAVLFVSVLLGAAANWVAPIMEDRLPIGSGVVSLLEVVVSGTVITLLCAATYRILPDVEIAWRDVWFGAGVTAALFLIGRTAIGWYLAHAAVASRFGAAASGVVFLLWVYYSAQIFFFGAELTQTRAERRGAPIVPAKGAVRIVKREIEIDEG